MTKDDGALDRAKAAFTRHAWSEAYEAFRAADAESALASELLEDYAAAAFWGAQPDASLALRERAFAGYQERKDARGAGRVALELARDNALRNSRTVATAWFARAERA